MFLKLNGIDGESRSVEGRGLAPFLGRLQRSGLQLAISKIDDSPLAAADVKALLRAAGLRSESAAKPTGGDGHKDWFLTESMSAPW